MYTSPDGSEGSDPGGGPYQPGTPDSTCTDANTTNDVRGNSNTGTDFANVSDGYYHTVSVGVNESERIQEWLSPLEPNTRHEDVSNRRLDGVGDWVLQKTEFESWCQSPDGSVNPTLLCHGGQGVGKTYISSLVIDTLCGQARGQNIAVLSLYCDYQAREDQSATKVIGSLLRQVVAAVARVPDEIRDAFEESKKRGGKRPRLPDMLKLFVGVISSMERVYICVDAVDELLPQNRSGFLRALRQVVEEASNARLFLTGRPHIRRELDKHLTRGAHIIHIVPDQGDITRYLSRKMDDDDDRDADLMTENLKNDIVKMMLEKASEMFLLVALNIDAILGETTLAKRKKMLQKVATTGVGLENVYDQTLQRIREQGRDRSRLGMEVLNWVFHSKRPLRIDELCHALAIEVGTSDLDHETIPPQDTVLGSCVGLVAVDETSTVRPLHYTLREYLSGILSKAPTTFAWSCLTYLNYERVKGLPANQISALVDMPFLKYSSLYWADYAMQLSSYHGAHMKALALKLLNRYGDHISATILCDQIQISHPDPLPHPDPLSHHLFSGLHCASYFGIHELVEALINNKGCDINGVDCMGFTPLMWASFQGNQRVVQLLLAQHNISFDKPGNGGRTPLHLASGEGHEEVVRLLLSRYKPYNVNLGQPDNDGQTPLCSASRNGHTEVVKRLLNWYGIPPKGLSCGGAPLWWASSNGHEGVVRLLLARGDVDPNYTDRDDRSPLWRASSNGHVGVVRLLLARDDVNPNFTDRDGQTPLSAASMRGHMEIVALLQPRTTAVSGIN